MDEWHRKTASPVQNFPVWHYDSGVLTRLCNLRKNGASTTRPVDADVHGKDSTMVV